MPDVAQMHVTSFKMMFTVISHSSKRAEKTEMVTIRETYWKWWIIELLSLMFQLRLEWILFDFIAIYSLVNSLEKRKKYS